MKDTEARRRLSFALLLAACLVVPLKKETAEYSRFAPLEGAKPVSTVSRSDGYGTLFSPGPDGWALIDLERWLVQFVAAWLVCLWLNGASPWPKSFDRTLGKANS